MNNAQACDYFDQWWNRRSKLDITYDLPNETQLFAVTAVYLSQQTIQIEKLQFRKRYEHD
jgi:hypothetical protein